MINKKQEWTRVGIFMLFSFVPAWIIAIVMNSAVGFDVWFTDARYSWLAAVIMFTPTLGNIAARLITKEGWKDSLLHFRFKGNLGRYALSLIIPVVTFILGGLLLTATFGKFNKDELLQDSSVTDVVTAVIMIMVFCAPGAWLTFGEEFGWRGYLYPKLDKLIGAPAACIVGGIIWGVWHAPLTVCGHNYGTEYWGFPYLGVVLMSIFCIGVGTIQMWLTKKTGSVYPAALMHACINGGAGTLGIAFTMGFDGNYEVYHHLIVYVPMLVTAAVILVKMILDSRKKSAEKADSIK